ncbi:MAG: hypothetical protein HGA35_05245 [Erysipelotrichaceae bacterium]|nr:hypothetical protein [Erysipelotrichaceae bacterium]
MFWIILAIITFIGVAILTKGEELFISIMAGLLFLIIGVAISIHQTYSIEEFAYTEIVGTENTSWVTKDIIAYKKYDGKYDTTDMTKVRIDKLGGELYIEYIETRSWNDSFFKFKTEGIEEIVTLVMK